MEDPKKKILEGLKDGTLSRKTFKKGERKSDIWKTFDLIVDSEDKPQEFVQCRKCRSLFKYLASKTGNSHLKRHTCAALSGSSSSNKQSSFLGFVVKKVNTDIKRQVTEKCVDMCAEDLRPFEIVAGKGFKSFCQCLLKIGAQHGVLDANELLPDPTTISRHLKIEAARKRSEILPEIQKFMEMGICSATTDMWTDDFKKNSFTTFTVHNIDDDWILQNRVLFTCIFPEDQKKTGENIKTELVRRFTEWGLDYDLFGKLTFVTDQGANIVAALKRYKRFGCCAHILNTVLRHTFNEGFLKDSGLEEVTMVIQNCKALVTFMKQSGCLNMLPKTLHQEVETRWNTKLAMLKSVFDQFDNIHEILLNKGEVDRLSDIDRDVLVDIIAFLEPFKEASMELEQEKCPTFHLIFLHFKRLLKSLQVDSGGTTETDQLRELKKKAEEVLKAKLEVKDDHKIATFLNPKFRQLRMLSPDEKSALLRKVKAMVEAEGLGENAETTLHEELETPISAASSSVWEDWEDENVTANRNIDEVEAYIEAKSANLDMPVLNWWREHAKEFPFLARIARRVLGRPATSAPSERNFSSAGRVFEERRTNLRPENVDSLLFLHNNNIKN